MKQKRFYFHKIIVGVLLLTFLTACGTEEPKEEVLRTYQVQKEVVEYRGYFVSKYISEVSLGGQSPRIVNGSHVKKNEVVTNVANGSGEKPKVAPFDAQVEISHGMMTFYSEELQFVFRASEKQMQSLRQTPETLYVRALEGYGKLTLESVLYDAETSVLGEIPNYKMTYNIEWYQNPIGLLYGNSGVMLESGDIKVPKDCVFEEDGNYYVIKDGNKVNVVVENKVDYWIVHEGVMVDDILQRGELSD